MAVWPKTLYTSRATLQTARMALRLRQDHADSEQDLAFHDLLQRAAATEFWRAAGIEAEIDYELFRTRIPLRGYEEFAPFVQRMMSGEPNVLAPGHCAFFATTAGTTDGSAKYIPVPAEMLTHFRQAAHDALMFYTARVGHAGVFRGRHLFVDTSTALTPLSSGSAAHAYAGSLGGILTANLPSWAEKHLTAPEADVAKIADWDAKLDAIARRVSAQDVSLIAGVPPWLQTLATALRDKFSGGGQSLGNLQELWPNLECCVHTGVPLAPYQAELRAALGPDVNFHEIYAAAEGVIAAQDRDAAAGLRLIANRGIFFEFVPVADLASTRPELLGPKAVPLRGVKPGIDYAIVLSTPAGLVRYMLGDVVRFTSVRPPRLTYVGRTQLELAAFGERVSEREITDALLALCERHGWVLVNFHVAPLFSRDLTGQNRGRHEWWIELRPGTVVTPIGPQMAAALDAELQRINPQYAARRKSGIVEPPFVRLVMPGVFEYWMRFHHRWGGQNKMPRCRSDRLVADELAQITNFAPH